MRNKRAAVVVVLMAVTLSPLSASHADDVNDKKKSVDSSIDDLQETLSGTSKQLLAGYSRLKTTQAQLASAQSQLKKAKSIEAAANRKDAELATRLAAAEKAQANAQQELAQGQAAIKETEAKTGQFAAQVYRNNGVSPQLSLVLGSSSPDDFAAKSAMVDYVLRFQSGSLRSLEQQKASNITTQDRLNSVQEQVAVLREQAAESLRESEKASAEAGRQASKVKAALAAQATVVAAIKARKAEEDAKLAELKAESNRLQGILRERAARAKAKSGGGGGQIGPTGGLLNKPVPGAPVTSPFGWRIHPIYHSRRLHAGIDFGVPCGTPVYAAATGDVVRAGRAGGYGNQVVLDNGLINGSGMATTYNHLSRFAVTSGRVNRGQLIAYSGTTGSSTGCHLHFEVRLNGTPVNPAPYL